MALRMTRVRRAIRSWSDTSSRKRGLYAPSASRRNAGSVTQSTPSGRSSAPACHASAIITMAGCSAEPRSAWAIEALRRMWPNPTIPCEYIATRGGDGGWVGRLSRRGRPGRTRGGDVAALERSRMSSTTLSIWASSWGVASVPDRAPSASWRLEPLSARVAARPGARCSSAGTTGSPHAARSAALNTYFATRWAAQHAEQLRPDRVHQAIGPVRRMVALGEHRLLAGAQRRELRRVGDDLGAVLLVAAVRLDDERPAVERR